MMKRVSSVDNTTVSFLHISDDWKEQSRLWHTQHTTTDRVCLVTNGQCLSTSESEEDDEEAEEVAADDDKEALADEEDEERYR